MGGGGVGTYSTCGGTLLCRPRRRWEDNIKMNFRVRIIGFKVMECIHLAHYRVQWRTVVNMVMNLHSP
jgi:hypothetical protein